jgi:hypothetical protein
MTEAIESEPAKDLGLTAEQADRLFGTLAEQQMCQMENATP